MNAQLALTKQLVVDALTARLAAHRKLARDRHAADCRLAAAVLGTVTIEKTPTRSPARPTLQALTIAA